MSTPTAAMAVEKETVTIDRLVYGGEALARRASGEVLFVPGALPTETVDVEIGIGGGKKKQVRLTNIVSPSEFRITPPCPVFSQCGGCQWQHLAVDQQRYWKQAIVEESFRRIGKFADVPLRPIIAGDAATGYRNRLTWDVLRTPSGVTLTYHEEGTHTPISGVPCLLGSQGLNRLAEALKPVIAQCIGIQRLQLLETAQGQRLVVLLGKLAESTQALAWDTLLPWADLGVVGVVQLDAETPHTLWGQDTVTETIGGKPFQISAGSFFQVNPQIAEALTTSVLSAIPQGTSHLLDLYAGGGLFGLLAAPNVQAVTLVESGNAAVADAKANIAAHGVQNVSVMQGDVTIMGPKLPKSPSVALVDPPRARACLKPLCTG